MQGFKIFTQKKIISPPHRLTYCAAYTVIISTDTVIFWYSANTSMNIFPEKMLS